MVRIPVQRRRDTRWWGWLIGLFLVVGGIFLLAVIFEAPAEREPVGTAKVVADEPRPGPLVTDEARLFAAEPLTLVGREVDVGDLRVTRVLGERLFYAGRIGDELGPQLLVYVPSSVADEAGVRIAPGQRIVDLSARGEPLAAHRLTAWNLSPELRRSLAREPVYLHAQALEIAERP